MCVPNPASHHSFYYVQAVTLWGLVALFVQQAGLPQLLHAAALCRRHDGRHSALLAEQQQQGLLQRIQRSM
jgi:hypothetical protein